MAGGLASYGIVKRGRAAGINMGAGFYIGKQTSQVEACAFTRKVQMNAIGLAVLFQFIMKRAVFRAG